jgi:hypothetical protein
MNAGRRGTRSEFESGRRLRRRFDRHHQAGAVKASRKTQIAAEGRSPRGVQGGAGRRSRRRTGDRDRGRDQKENGEISCWGKSLLHSVSKVSRMKARKLAVHFFERGLGRRSVSSSREGGEGRVNRRRLRGSNFLSSKLSFRKAPPQPFLYLT